MNPYQVLMPLLLAGFVIVVVARWAVRQSRWEKESGMENIAKSRLDLSQVEEAVANPGVPASEYITEWERASILQNDPRNRRPFH